MKNRRITLIVAAVLALGTGWLTLTYVTSMQRSQAAVNAQRLVLVASQEIPARVPITADMLARTAKPASAVEPDAVADPTKVVGSLSLITIPAGATITASEIGHPSDVGLPVRLTPGMRAVSIQIDKVKGVSGLVEPGDRVDVIAIPPRQGPETPTGYAILRGVRVLAIGQQLEQTSATPSPQEAASETATLEVTPKQADLLAMADINTILRLALRSPREPVNSLPTEALHFANPQGNAPAAGAPPAPAVASAQTDAALIRALADPQGKTRPQPSHAASVSGVTVIDGDRVGGTGEGN
jgi:pilus assembly protein CpaB